MIIFHPKTQVILQNYINLIGLDLIDMFLDSMDISNNKLQKPMDKLKEIEKSKFFSIFKIILFQLTKKKNKIQVYLKEFS